MNDTTPPEVQKKIQGFLNFERAYLVAYIISPFSAFNLVIATSNNNSGWSYNEEKKHCLYFIYFNFETFYYLKLLLDLSYIK